MVPESEINAHVNACLDAQSSCSKSGQSDALSNESFPFPSYGKRLSEEQREREGASNECESYDVFAEHVKEKTEKKKKGKEREGQEEKKKEKEEKKKRENKRGKVECQGSVCREKKEEEEEEEEGDAKRQPEATKQAKKEAAQEKSNEEAGDDDEMVLMPKNNNGGDVLILNATKGGKAKPRSRQPRRKLTNRDTTGVANQKRPMTVLSDAVIVISDDDA